jgi:hypothetical protein
VYIPVGADGFVYADDVAWIILHHYKHRVTQMPTAHDLLHMVACSVHLGSKSRFQASVIQTTADNTLLPMGTPYTILVRAIQGHSGQLGQNIDPLRLCERLYDAEEDDIKVLIHHTWSGYIVGMVGRGGPGILPGGIPANADGVYAGRTHVHCSNRPYKDGQFPDNFKKRGTDCAVYIDAQKMIDHGHHIYRGPGGVILIPSAVEIPYIARVVMVEIPLITLFRRVDEYKSSHQTANTFIGCRNCGKRYNLGTCFCTARNGCWQPMTFTAISDKYTYVLDEVKRDKALLDRYGVEPKFINTAGSKKGASVDAHTLDILGDETYFPTMGVPKRTRKKAVSKMRLLVPARVPVLPPLTRRCRKVRRAVVRC